MKILLFNNSAYILSKQDFCIENATGEFAKELQSLGHKVTFYGQALPNVKNTTDIFEILKNGMTVKGMQRKKNKLLNYLSLYLKSIPEIYKADFVYFFYPNALRFLVFFAIVFRKKYGLYIRGIDDLKKCESQFFYKKAFKIFTVADFFTNYVNTINGNQVASTIRPMIMFDESDIEARQNYRENIQDLNILYLGRMTNDKGIIELLYAIKELVKNNHNPKLFLVGSGEYLEELKKLTMELEIIPFVDFKGPVFEKEEIKKYYQNSDVYVLPTHHEGFPRTLYEAMIFGTPIITTFVGGISGIMINKQNCIEIQPKSVESILESLIYAQQNYKEMVEMAQNGQATIQTIFETRKSTHAQMLHQELKKRTM